MQADGRRLLLAAHYFELQAPDQGGMATESVEAAADLPEKFQCDHALAEDETRLILIHRGGWADNINISIL